jgi:hypothetical protein
MDFLTIFNESLKKNVREYRRGNQKRQSREAGNIEHTGQTKQKLNTICVGHHYTQTNTNNVNYSVYSD